MLAYVQSLAISRASALAVRERALCTRCKHYTALDGISIRVPAEEAVHRAWDASAGSTPPTAAAGVGMAAYRRHELGGGGGQSRMTCTERALYDH